MMIIEQIGIGFSLGAFAFSIFGWGYLLGRRVERIGSARGYSDCFVGRTSCIGSPKLVQHVSSCCLLIAAMRRNEDAQAPALPRHQRTS